MHSFSKRASALFLSAFAGIVFFGTTTKALADQHTTGVPLLSSRPGATYTVFLDPAGFNFNGTWGSGSTPGNNLAINGLAGNATFGAADVEEIKAIYAAMANQYRSFDVNVTTIDPATGANAATDAARQAYYDSQAHMMHTIIGPGGTPNWHPGADGLALLSTIDHVANNSGEHTNFMFTEAQDGDPSIANGTYIGNIASHETGHTFGLHHQSDFAGATLVKEYSDGDTTAGNGSYVATMGGADGRQRVAWRVGSSNGAQLTDDSGGPPIENQQNDIKTILSNDSMTYADSGIGHSFATATVLPLTGKSVDVSNPLHRGVISPASAASPNPIRTANYTHDIFAFKADGTDTISLTVHDGNDLLVPGTADNGATLRSILMIFSATDTATPLATVTEDASTLLETYTSLLATGDYFAEILSFGGHDELNAPNNAAQYYDMGGYFLTGSGFAAVPEPAFLSLFAIGVMSFAARRRRAESAGVRSIR